MIVQLICVLSIIYEIVKDTKVFLNTSIDIIEKYSTIKDNRYFTDYKVDKKQRNKKMADKNIILKNDFGCLSLPGDKKIKLKIGTWSDDQQKKFIQSLYDYKQEEDNGPLCCFSVQYDTTNICEIGLDDGVGDTINDWPKELRECKDNEMAIVVEPWITKDANDPAGCKCGIKYSHECPKYIKAGKCNAPSIMKLLGQALFPDKYSKPR